MTSPRSKTVFVRVRLQIRPRADGADLVSGDDNRAVFDRRRGDWAESIRGARESLLTDSGGAADVLSLAASLCLCALFRLWRLRICCSIFLVTRSIAAYSRFHGPRRTDPVRARARRMEQLNCFSGTRVWSCSRVTRASTPRGQMVELCRCSDDDDLQWLWST